MFDIVKNFFTGILSSKLLYAIGIWVLLQMACIPSFSLGYLSPISSLIPENIVQVFSMVVDWVLLYFIVYVSITVFHFAKWLNELEREQAVIVMVVISVMIIVGYYVVDSIF